MPITLFDTFFPVNLLLRSLVFLCLAGPVAAQVAINIKMDRRNYMVDEAASAVVTITNRSGRELFLHSKSMGRSVRSWLDLQVRSGTGRQLQQLKIPGFRAARVPAGQSVSKRIILNHYFRLAEPGLYIVNAVVSDPASNLSYKSGTTNFTLANGRNLQRFSFGVPKSKAPLREYKVLSFNDGKKTSVFAQVMDKKRSRSLGNLRLGNAMLFFKPRASIDSKNNLHVLYLAKPEVYVHATVNQNCKLVGFQFYKRGRSGQPRFVSFANGEVKVQGGIPFDPSAERRQQIHARRLSDRPGQ